MMTGMTIKTPRRKPAILVSTALDDIFDQFFNDPRALIKKSTDGYPLTDIYKDDDDNQVIEMALAGFTRHDVTIECVANTITISCEKNETLGSARYERKIARRAFSKKFIDYDNHLDFSKTNASFVNGLLKITIPMVESAKPLSIKIN